MRVRGIVRGAALSFRVIAVTRIGLSFAKLITTNLASSFWLQNPYQSFDGLRHNRRLQARLV